MKHNMSTRFLSVLLAVAMLLSVFVAPVSAASAAEVADNYDGSQLWLNYRLTSDAAMLSQYRSAVKAIVVENYDANPTFRHSRNGQVWQPTRPSGAKEVVPTSTLEAARLELSRAAGTLLGQDIPYASAVTDGAVVVGTPTSSPIVASLNLGSDLEKVGDEGYLIRSVTVDGKSITVVAGNTEIGALYGTYAFIRLMQTLESVKDLNIASSPKVNHRRLNNWDTERLYAGTNATGEGSSTGGDGSIFAFSSNSNSDRLPVILDRYIVFARMCASVGINEITINNVNADYAYLSENYILMEAALADALRPYGVKIGLSVRYVSPTQSGCNTSADAAAGGPSQISGNNANNPYAAEYQNWWTKKTEQIRSRIPDFVGYTVKANSEGQPGPQDYGYDHGDGAYGLGQALAKVNDGKPNNMTLFWRTFVYNASVDVDRLKRAYIEFKPINDDPNRSFGDNVFVQTKNGPLDFQGREPIHPMFGAMDVTNQAIEVQITQEYTGHHVSLCYLAPEWEEIYKTDTYAEGEGTLVGEILDGSAQGQKDTAIVGVNNIGNSPNMTGNHFGQANFFAFGRQAWDWTQDSEEIAEDWVRMTWSNNQEVVDTIVEMMMGSYEALVSYQTPFGVGHQMTGTGTHYFPNPSQIIYNGGSIRDDWSPAYYSRVDGVGVGYNRTSHEELTSFGMLTGSNLAGQYSDALAAQYDDINTTPENLLLWFHHVPWDFKMDSGRTFWEEAVYLMQEGVQYVSWMREAWASLEGKIDARRFNEVTEKLWRQEIDASEWRDFYRSYWQANNGLDIPVDDGILSVAITLGEGSNAVEVKGFDLSVDSFNKTRPGNLPNSDSRYNRYIAAGGSIADASGSPFSSMFVPVDTAYSVAVPSGVSHKITGVKFLSSEGGEGTYEIVSNTDTQAVLKVTREGDFGPLVKTYTFNFVADATLASLKVNDTAIKSFDADTASYAVLVDDDVTAVPVISAVPTDSAAIVDVQQAASIPGTATVTVTNGSAKQVYTVSVARSSASSEDFEGGELNADFSWVRENAANWKLSDSKVTITAASGDIKGSTNTAANILLRDVNTGDWEAVTKLELSKAPSQSGQQAALLVYQDDGNYLKVNVEFYSSSGWSAQTYCRASAGVEKNGTYTELFYDALEIEENIAAAENVIWLQIIKEGNTYRLGWATDGEADFKNLGKTEVSLPAPKVGVMATGTSFQVACDSLTVTDSYDAQVTTSGVRQPGAIWVSTWGTAEEKVDTTADRMPKMALKDTTVRQIIRVTTSGETMKLKLSNQYGKTDVVVKSMHIAKQVAADKSTIYTDTDTLVTVGGSEEFVIPAGAIIETDPVYFPVNALENVAVSMYFGDAPTANITGHRGARATTYQVSGNAVSAETLNNAKTTLSWFFLADVALEMAEGGRAVVCFGDSITDGYGTDASYLGRKPDSYTRWVDYFAKRLQADENTKNVGVINEGIGSNAMLTEVPVTDAGKDRYARDLLDHDAVEYVIILFGVNDLEKLSNTSKYDAMIAEYEKMITLAHENGIKVYAAPILPFGTSSSYYSAASEQLRTMINDWFRSEYSHVDAIIDFESAVADPANPKNILEKYTHSDGLHPYDGYDVMANAIDLELFYPVDDENCEHEYELQVVAPTCTEAGYTLHICTKCGSSYKTNKVAQIDHVWDDGVVTVKPTTQAAGEMTFTCTLGCGTTYTKRIPRKSGSGLERIDFTDPADASKFDVVNQKNAAIAEGTGLKLTATRPAFEPCNGQNSGDQATTPEDVVVIPASGDFTATMQFDFSTGSARNGYYQFFGFYASQGEDFQNLAGIRGGDGAMQNFLRVDGTITADSDDLNSKPGLASAGTYWYQIVKEGTTYICLRSADGEEFTEMFRYENTGIEADCVVIDAYTGMTEGYEFTLKSVEIETEAAALPSIDFTAPEDADKFDILGQNTAAIVEGTGLTLTTTRNAVETCNGQNSGAQATTPEDIVSVPVSGDWTATLEFTFSKGSAGNGYYQFFGMYASEGEDFQNMAGIRGGDGALQNFLRVDGTITADSSDLNSKPGLANSGETYWYQITKEGTTYICSRSSDGNEFTEMFRYENTGIEADSILIDAYTGMTAGYQFTLKSLEFEGGSAPAECEHVTEIQNAKAATCTEAGYTGDAVCTKCGKVIEQGTVIAALGHDWDNGVVTKPATATEEGIRTFSCSRCDAKREEVIEKIELPALAIVTEPVDFVGSIGETAKFAVEVNRPDVTYQWMWSKDGGKTWEASEQTGFNTAEVSVQLKAFRNGQMYQVVVTDSTGATVTSAAVKMSTPTAGLKITQNPADVKVAVNQAAVFSVKAEGEGLTYQWMYSNNGGSYWSVSAADGAATPSMTIPGKTFRNGQMYKCVVTDASGNVVESAPATMTVG